MEKIHCKVQISQRKFCFHKKIIRKGTKIPPLPLFSFISLSLFFSSPSLASLLYPLSPLCCYRPPSLFHSHFPSFLFPLFSYSLMQGHSLLSSPPSPSLLFLALFLSLPRRDNMIALQRSISLMEKHSQSIPQSDRSRVSGPLSTEAQRSWKMHSTLLGLGSQIRLVSVIFGILLNTTG